MGRKKEKEEEVEVELEEEEEWHFFWKNIGWFGMLLRVLGGVAIIMWARSNKEDSKAMAATVYGASMIFDGLCRWCSLRAILKKPTKRAYRRHYPEEA
jgi:hypothetical protein